MIEHSVVYAINIHCSVIALENFKSCFKEFVKPIGVFYKYSKLLQLCLTPFQDQYAKVFGRRGRELPRKLLKDVIG